MYAANYYIKNYLVGKGLSVVSQDYRYYYFDEGESLTLALSEIPVWMKIFFGNLWS